MTVGFFNSFVISVWCLIFFEIWGIIFYSFIIADRKRDIASGVPIFIFIEIIYLYRLDYMPEKILQGKDKNAIVIST